MHVGIVVHIVPDAGHRGVHRPGERVEGLGRVQVMVSTLSRRSTSKPPYWE